MDESAVRHSILHLLTLIESSASNTRVLLCQADEIARAAAKPVIEAANPLILARVQNGHAVPSRETELTAHAQKLAQNATREVGNLLALAARLQKCVTVEGGESESANG